MLCATLAAVGACSPAPTATLGRSSTVPTPDPVAPVITPETPVVTQPETPPATVPEPEPPAPEPASQPTPDPSGLATPPEAILCSRLAHPAHHRPCPLGESAAHSHPAAVGGGRCGGSLPSCSVMQAESGGNPNLVYPAGCGGRGCYGKWQFDPRTSQSLGYDRPMNEYPESVQDEAARRLWANGAGCSHWAAC